MITLPTRKPARNRKTGASQADNCPADTRAGSLESKQKQAIQPDIDSAALHRRAKELSTEIQRETIVENNEKVERIKAELANGTYQVDADAIAEKLMEFDFQIKDKPQR